MSSSKKLIQASAGNSVEKAWNLKYADAPFPPSVLESIEIEGAFHVNSAGTRAVSVGFSNTLYPWTGNANVIATFSDGYDYNARYDLTSPSNLVSGICLSPDDSLVFIQDYTAREVLKYSGVNWPSYGFIFLSLDSRFSYATGGTDQGIFASSTLVFVATNGLIKSYSYAGVDSGDSLAISGYTVAGIYFSDDGTRLFTCDTNGTARSYTLGTAWTLSTATLDTGTLTLTSSTINISVNSGNLFASDPFFTAREVTQYYMSTPFDITTAITPPPPTYYFSIDSQIALSFGMFISETGTKMYHVDYVNNRIAEWTLTTANDMSTATFVGYSPIITGVSVIRAVYFRADGLRMYITDSTTNTVRQYSLSTAWAVSTISLQATYTRPDADPLAQGISFSDDGTQMYIAGYSAIEQFTLSTPWSVSTASLLQQVAMPQAIYISDLYFKPDGTKVYISDDSNSQPRKINQYDLSTAWDVSTITYKDSFSTTAYGGGVGSVSFGGSEGEIMYILFDDDDQIMTVYWT